MATAADIIAIARPLTDHDSDTQVTDAQLVTLLSPRYLALRRKLGRAIPSLYRTVVTWAATGPTQDVTAAPLSLSDFERVWRMRWLNGVAPSGYSPMGVANPLDPERIPYARDFVFLVRTPVGSGPTIEIYPASAVSGNTFELTYMQKGAPLTATSTPVVLPDGADYVLAQLLAADIRIRFEEDPSSHLAIADREYQDLRWNLMEQYGQHPAGLAEEGFE